MSSVDISPIVQAAITVCATALSVFGSMALLAIAKRFNVQVSAGQAANYDAALDKALQYGVTQSTQLIKDKGWDHVDTQSAVVADALNYVVKREPAALAGVGLSGDFNDPHTRTIIEQALTRALPAAFTSAAASPATPPAPASAPAAIIVQQAKSA